jgi:shikimate kinase
MMDEAGNIVLIGMPGVGKSTIGVLLAKALSRDFLDTDVLIQSREGRRLQAIIDSVGMAAFCAMEERHVLSLQCRGTVIATGGSVVYGEEAMAHLKSSGVVLHLDLPLALLKRRLSDLDARGVVMAPDQTLEALFQERQPLYQRHADITIDCTNRTHEHVVKDIITALGGRA